MGVLFHPGRPIARWAATGLLGKRPSGGVAATSAPTGGHRDGGHRAIDPRATDPRHAVGTLAYLPVRLGSADPCPGPLARALDALATGDAAILAELFTEDVVGWWPNFAITSRRELEVLMTDHDDALTDVRITSCQFCVGDDRVVAEWLLTGHHGRALLVGDDVLIEATNRQVVLAGVTLAHHRSDGIDYFHHYFDDTAILEQVLRPTP